jgi:glycosyltransferase involved in cell wall biosynthesis
MKGNDKLVHLLYGEKSLDNSARVMRRFGAKVIATMHHPIEHHPKICGDLRWVDSLDGVICLTPESKHYWASRVGVDRVHLVPHGIDTVHYSPLERNRHLVQGSGEPVEVFFAGSHERNFDELERVANLVIAEGLPVRFNLVGRRSSLRALGERAPETVRVYSDISDSAYVDLIRASDVTYVPLKCGTACNTVLESLACGVPVISTQGTVDFYLSGGGGSLISPGDHDAALGAILSYRGRRSSRSDAGKRAREVAETFAWPVVAAQTQAVYEKVRGQ